MKLIVPTSLYLFLSVVVWGIPDAWNTNTTYNKDDVVLYTPSGTSEAKNYIALQTGAGNQPDTSAAFWSLLDSVASSFSAPPGDPTTFSTPDTNTIPNSGPPDSNTTEEDEVRIVNISTRGYVGTGNDILIAGFILEGDETATKKCMIGVTAASLEDDLASGFITLKDPLLILYKDGVKDALAMNFGWTSLSDEDKAIIGDSAPSSDKDPAIVADLGPGSYTAIVMGVDGLTGIATVGVNDLKMDGGTGKIDLINISTRGYVKSDAANWMFAGFILEGPEDATLDVMIGNTAASLGDNPDDGFYTLKDPLMLLYKDGVEGELDRNDNWGDRDDSEKTKMSSINATPGDSKESAMVKSLTPGTYNTIMLGLGGTTGNAVIGVNRISGD